MAMLSAGEPDVGGIDVDDFIKAFTNGVNDSPARPPLIDMGGQYANHQPPNYKQHYPDTNSSPFEQTFGLTDISGHNSTEWFTNMDHVGIESVLGVSTPSSRGSSLETPNLSQGGFVGSIDPSRLQEANNNGGGGGVNTSTANNHHTLTTTGNSSDTMASPAWSVAHSLPHSTPTTTTQPLVDAMPSHPHPQQHHHHQRSVTMSSLPQPPSAASMMTLEYKPSDLEPPAPLGKRKRQGSLPDIFIPIPQSQPRVLQRSVSTGATMAFDGVTTDPSSPFLGASSPGPMSAPPVAHHAQSLAPLPPTTTNQGLQPRAPQSAALSKAQHSHGHTRAFSYSALATIPETPSSAPPEWTPMGEQQQQQQQQQNRQHSLGIRYTNTDNVSTYQVPQPPATPSLPSTSPMIHSAPMPPAATHQRQQSVPHSLPLSRPNSCPGTQPATAVPTHMASSSNPQVLAYSPTFQHQQLQHQQLQPPQHQFSPQLNQFSPQLQTISHPGLPAVGIGRPLLPPSSASHIRRSSDSELAFAMGPHGNVGAMLRSTSVPQAPGQAIRTGPVYGPSAIPPPPPVAHYSTMQYVFEPINHLGFGQPTGLSSPPRKRITSKRVGTCLKPGPKGKVKPKVEQPDMAQHGLQLSQPMQMHPDDERLVELANHGQLLPVSIEEFQSAFTITPNRCLVPKPSLELLTDRLMYATPEAIVDACFRWCYQIGTEFNKAAEKQSKFFRCCFEECAGSSGRIFMRKSAVDSHVRTHVGYRPFKCEADPECDARFVRKHDRDRHVATTHRNEKSFLCSDCGQNFARSDALLRHRAKRDACKARMG